MHLLLSDSDTIIARFHHVLMEKGAVTLIDSLPALWQGLTPGLQGLVVIDLDFPLLDVTFLMAEVRRIAPACKVLVLKEDFSTNAELALLSAGVVGCCSATLAPETTVRIVNMVLDGGVWISHAVMPQLLLQLQARSTAAPVVSPPAPPAISKRLINLTPREQQIARLVGGGASNKLIARELSITDRTVKAHLGAIFQKLGLPDRLQLALYVTNATAAEPQQSV